MECSKDLARHHLRQETERSPDTAVESSVERSPNCGGITKRKTVCGTRTLDFHLSVPINPAEHQHLLKQRFPFHHVTKFPRILVTNNYQASLLDKEESIKPPVYH